MKSATSLKKGIGKVRRDWLAERFADALSEVEHLLSEYPDHPQLLTMRAALIQLQHDEEGTPTLEDAKDDLLKVVELDEASPSAWIDLGYFVYAVENDAKASVKHFQKAVQLSRRLLKDALIGQAEALAELDEEAKAQRCLLEALQIASHNGKADLKRIVEQLDSLQDAGEQPSRADSK